MQYTGVGLRFLAQVIDWIVIAFAGGALAILAGDLPWTEGGPAGLSGLVGLAYFIVLEKAWGATLGKRALGLTVVMDDGSPLTWTGSLLRNVLRIVDGLFFYLVGAILVWTSAKRQRLGDRVGHTVVVRRGSETSGVRGGGPFGGGAAGPGGAPGEGPQEPIGWQPYMPPPTPPEPPAPEPPERG
jgi:uncharacterized RDD family membrane protein YckC